MNFMERLKKNIIGEPGGTVPWSVAPSGVPEGAAPARPEGPGDHGRRQPSEQPQQLSTTIRGSES
jgi:hypothetical protein